MQHDSKPEQSGRPGGNYHNHHIITIITIVIIKMQQFAILLPSDYCHHIIANITIVIIKMQYFAILLPSHYCKYHNCYNQNATFCHIITITLFQLSQLL